MTKLIIRCITNDVEFETIELELPELITESDWAIARSALPTLIAKAHNEFTKDVKATPSMTADFETVKGE